MSLDFVPKNLFFTKGIGTHKHKLASFELALRSSGVAHVNLVNVSSIFPPGCSIISRDDGLQMLRAGAITFCVLARNETNEAGRSITSAIGCSICNDPKMHGYLSEHEGFGETLEESEELAEDLSAYMSSTTYGILPENVKWDEAKEHFHLSNNNILKTQSIVSYAQGKKNMWTTTVALAVFIL